jgi:tetratricopeptide (TPR) repeat protein
MAIRAAAGRMRTLGAALLLLALTPARAQDRLQEYKARFQNASDPVRKARALPKLGEAELQLARQHTKEGNFAEALEVLRQYGDAVQSAFAGLKASGINAEKKPNGFKELEIHLRKSFRQFDDIIAAVPLNQRDPFQQVRRQLEAIDKELIDLLFPRQPGRHPEGQKPKR